MSFEIGASPGLDAIVFSDRDVGSMLILTGEDDAEVTLDGTVLQRKTRQGRLRIPNLKTTQHTVHLHKDGFKDPAGQTVTVVKGQEANLRFTFEPLPKLASLILENLPLGAQIALDDAPIGTVNSEGGLSHPNITPGQHSLSFAIPGYLPKRIERKFGPSETVRLSVADLDLKRAQATLEVVVAGNTAVTIEQNGHVIKQFTGSARLTLDEGTYIVVGRPASGAPSSSTVVLASGETKSVSLRATGGGMEGWQHPEEWKLQDGWYVHHAGGLVLYESPAGPASYTFALRLHRSRNPFSAGTKTRWVVAYRDPNNYIEMQLDHKFFYRTEIVDGARHDLPKLPHHIPDNVEAVTFSVDLLPTSLVQRYSTTEQNWQILDSWDRGKAPSAYPVRNFTDGKFGFLIPEGRDLEVSNFSYHPKPK
jgi:hypothetical protein